ncbi:MAG: putative phosphohistidine phosphatase, SixA [Bryobacterales bacterium]|nr:putative phosphohistidine phosphatase, SixA [Bryobacterales bacterium]
MQVYILRHGIAEGHTARRRDSDRALTNEGTKKLASVLKVAGKAGVAPSLILTSPYVRARQTAEMAAEALNCPKPPLDIDSLVPHSSPQAVWNDVRDHRTEEALLLAGHEPLLSQVVGYFLAVPALQFDFKKGALVAMTIDNFRGEPHGVLQWILTPRLANG